MTLEIYFSNKATTNKLASSPKITVILEGTNRIHLLQVPLGCVCAFRQAVLLIDEVVGVTTERDIGDAGLKCGLAPPVHRTTHI